MQNTGKCLLSIKTVKFIRIHTLQKHYGGVKDTSFFLTIVLTMAIVHVH
jgi:hypothetical protein